MPQDLERHLRLLEAGSHVAAASFLKDVAVSAGQPEPAQPSTEAERAPAPAAPRTAQEARRQEGEYLLERLRRDTGLGTGDDGWFGTAA